MLNTESCAAKSLIWISIFAICATSAWSFWGLPAPTLMIANILASDVAAFASRNQIATTGLIGIGCATLAYLFNGWRDRAENRHAIQRTEMRAGSVLAREAREIAAACDAALLAIAERPGNIGAIAADLNQTIAPADHLLLSASSSDFARLGAGTSTAARTIRASIRRLKDALSVAHADDAARSRNVATHAADLAATATCATRIFDALAVGGPSAADRVRVMPATLPATTAATSDPGNVHRLHSTS